MRPRSAAGPASVLTRNATFDTPSSPSSSRGATTTEVLASPLMAIIVARRSSTRCRSAATWAGSEPIVAPLSRSIQSVARVPSGPCTAASTARSGRKIGSRMRSSVGETFAGKIAEGHRFDRQPRPSTQAPTTIARNSESALHRINSRRSPGRRVRGSAWRRCSRSNPAGPRRCPPSTRRRRRGCR